MEKIQQRIDKYLWMMSELVKQQRGCSELYWNLNETVWELKNLLANSETTDTRSVSNNSF